MQQSLEVNTVSALKQESIKIRNCNHKDWIDVEGPKKFWLSPIKQVNMGEFSQNMTRRLKIEEDIMPKIPVAQSSNCNLDDGLTVLSKSVLQRKTVRIGDKRLCNKLKESISPTICAKDKKGYQVETPWESIKKSHDKVKLYTNKLEHNYVISSNDKMTNA